LKRALCPLLLLIISLSLIICQISPAAAGTVTHITITAQGSASDNIPDITTLAATGISGLTATLNGRVDDSHGGIIEERGFDWGTSTGNYTASWTEGGVFGEDLFDYTKNNFPADSTVYFRAKARNSEGWGYGTEESFVISLVLPQPPTNFTATADGFYQVNLEWTLGSLATHTLILRKIGEPSSNMTDGIQVYWGTANTTADDINHSIIDDPIYYTAWSWNAVGYSENYTITTLTGGTPMSNIADAIIFGGIAMFCLGLLALSWHTRLSPLAAATGIIWLGLAVYCGINISEGGAVWIVLCTMSVFIGVVAVSMPMMWREPLIPKEEDGYRSIGEERDEGIPTPDPDYTLPGRQRDTRTRRTRSANLSQSQINHEYRGVLKHERRNRQ